MARRLKILWVSHLVPYPPKGGVLIRSFHLVTQLARYHDVDLFAFNQPRLIKAYFKTEEEGLDEARMHLQKFFERYHVEPIASGRGRFAQWRLAFRSLFTSDPYTINWLKSSQAKRRLESWIASGSYDLVHFDTISLAPFISESQPNCYSLDHHNVESHMMRRRATKQRNLIRKFYYLIEAAKLARYEKKNLAKFHVHLVCSRDDEHRLKKIDPNLSVSVIPNGVEIPKDIEWGGAGSNRLLFIGGLDWYPNADAMNFFVGEIWPLLSQEFPDLILDVVGKNPSRQLRDAASLDSRILLHGFVENIEEIYRRCAVYICPIRDGGGTKLKVLDALAHAVPMVAHSLACEGIDVVDKEHVLIADSPDRFAECVAEIIRNPIYGRTLGVKGRELVLSTYDVEIIGCSLATSIANTVQDKCIGSS